MDTAPETAPQASSPIVSAQQTMKTSWGAITGLLLVVLIVVAGAFYMLGERVAHERQPLQAIEAQSESTEPQAIRADLVAGSPETFEDDIDAAFAELDAALAE